MSRTALRLDLSTGSWLGDVSRRVPSATLRVDETVSVDGDGPPEPLGDESTEAGEDAGTVATVRVAGTDRDRVEDALGNHERVARETVVARRGEVRTLRVVGRGPAYLPATRAIGLPIESTVEVADGRATVTVVGDRDRIKAFGRRLAGERTTPRRAPATRAAGPARHRPDRSGRRQSGSGPSRAPRRCLRTRG